MPTVAQKALVSKATAYRYFPDLAALLREALADVWPTAREVMAPVSHDHDATRRMGRRRGRDNDRLVAGGGAEHARPGGDRAG
jgi:AcrR family transcriptional regulator